MVTCCFKQCFDSVAKVNTTKKWVNAWTSTAYRNGFKLHDTRNVTIKMNLKIRHISEPLVIALATSSMTDKS